MVARRAGWVVPTIGVAALTLLCIGVAPMSHLATGAPTLGGAAAQPTPSPSARTDSSAAPGTPLGGNEGPHPGTLEIWEIAPGGAVTLDPAVAYGPVDEEPMMNVYQTLIAYNGTDVGPDAASFVPELATCVPGSTECVDQFGSDLVYPNATTGAPQYYTFEIDAGARFFDPSIGGGFPVYPSDVLFSLARTLAWSDLPTAGATPGSVAARALLPPGNSTWDNGLHSPYNNTPQNVLGDLFVNNSLYCPASAVVATDGCVTFNVGPSGTAWPYFLELVADSLGASVVPCGVFSQSGATVPGFTGTGAEYGDGPCWLPGDASSTNDSSFENYLSAEPFTGWDSFEELAENSPGVQPSVRYNETGSGPYYLGNPADSSGYQLYANPAYNAPVGCAGQPGCQPIRGSYAATVRVVWESGGDGVGLSELEDGVADSAQFTATDTGTILTIASGDPYRLLRDLPSLQIGFSTLALNFSVANEQAVDPTEELNVNGTFLSNVALRQFLVHAYPYATINTTIWRLDGVPYGTAYGGALPHGLGPYASNASFPAGDPVSDPSVPGNVSWWWDELTTPGSLWYNATDASCTTLTPCRWAVVVPSGERGEDDVANDWVSAIANFSGGALEPYSIAAGAGWATTLSDPPGTYPYPTVVGQGLTPEYPDPADYAAPLYAPTGIYPYPNADAETLTAPGQSSSNTTLCPASYSSEATLQAYAEMSQLPNVCQSGAYQTMTDGLDAAAQTADSQQRVQDYALADEIANELALYVYDPQTVGAIVLGDWIEATTVDENPIVGGAGVQPWYDWGYASNFFNVTFEESGLPVATPWSVTMGGATRNTTAALVEFSGVQNGTYPFTIGSVPGYIATPPAASVGVQGTDVTVDIAFANSTGGEAFDLAVVETGLPTATAWQSSATPVGTNSTVVLSGGSSVLTFVLPEGNYTVVPGAVVGYTASPASVVVDLDDNTNVEVVYTSTSVGVVTLTVSETGLPAGTNWSATARADSTGSLSSVDGPAPSLSLTLSPGEYTVSTLPVGTYLPEPSDVSIDLFENARINFTFSSGSATAYPITFVPNGLAGGNWGVMISGPGGAGAEGGSGSLTFGLPNGTYSWSVTNLPSGETATPSGGTVVLRGAGLTVVVNVSSSSPPPSYPLQPVSANSDLTYAVVGGLAVAVLAGLGVVIRLRTDPGRPPPRRSP